MTTKVLDTKLYTNLLRKEIPMATATKESLQEAILRRYAIQYKLKQMEDYIATFSAPNQSLHQLKVRIPILKDIWKQFDDVQFKIERLDQTIPIEEHMDVRSNFTNRWCNVVAEMEKNIHQNSQSTQKLCNLDQSMEEVTLGQETQTVQNSCQPNKLTEQDLTEPNSQHSKLQVTTEQLCQELGKIKQVLILQQEIGKKFDGDQSKYEDFENSFKNVLVKSGITDDIQRFQTLKSWLKDEALRVVEALPDHEQNYNSAWANLEYHFKHSQADVEHHVLGIVNAPAVTEANHIAINKLLNSIEDHLNFLKRLKFPVHAWDLLLVASVLEKLDPETKAMWENSLDPTTLPSYQQLVDFLKKRSAKLQGKLKRKLSIVDVTKFLRVDQVDTPNSKKNAKKSWLSNER